MRVIRVLFWSSGESQNLPTAVATLGRSSHCLACALQSVQELVVSLESSNMGREQDANGLTTLTTKDRICCGFIKLNVLQQCSAVQHRPSMSGDC